MTATVKVTTKDRTGGFKKILEDVKKMQVYVGIPEENAARKDEEITNPELAFLHTHGVRAASMRKEMEPELEKGAPYSAAHQMYVQAHGSPLYRVPPRPIIEPAIEAKGNKEPIAEELGEAAKAMFKGDRAEALKHLEDAGRIGEEAARRWFEDPRNDWPENAQATIEAKGSDRPLIDTGELRKSIIYVVKDGGAA